MKLIQDDLQAIIEGVGLPLYDFEGSEILISGACGFLGSWFVALFQELNKNYFKTPCTVLALDSFIATDRKNHIAEITDPHIFFKEGDISTFKLEGKVDYIIHAAGVASPIYYRKFPIETIEGMVMGLSNILKFTVKSPVKSILVFSSSEMYGNPIPEAVPTPETYYGNVSAIGPRSCYDESKRMEEAMCASYYRIHNTPVKWVRPFNCYGPGMRIQDDRVVPKFTFQMLKNEPITVHVPGVQTRTFCYVTDGIIGFLKAMLIGKNGEAYNIGNQEGELGMLDLAYKMAFLFNPMAQINKVEMPTEYPQDQAQRRCPDITKAREQLQFNPKIDLDTGLKKTWEWGEYLLHGERKTG